MLKKVYKKIQHGDDTLTIYGSNRSIKLYSAVSPWERDRAKDENRKPNISPCFNYRNKRYFLLDEFMCVDPHAPDWMKEFHGYTNDTFFSGVLVKLDSENETVKAFTFIS
jgi:hypothetical protein